ncbi:MAG: hypothetical protein AAGL10_06800 [Pseudomonadota bacterium]
MSKIDITKAVKQHKLSLVMATAALSLALPSTGLALVNADTDGASFAAAGFNIFTPGNVDPDLAARFANVAENDAMRFTPAGTGKIERERTVTVAVRLDAQTAKAISVRKAIEAAPGAGKAIAPLDTTRFNLGTARGYQSFARPVELPDNVRDLKVPDLSEFQPAGPRAEKKPGRLQPRIELEDEQVAGRSPNTLDSLGSQTVDLGGSFRISSKVDVTAGVRYSQERERLAPLTTDQQDSQAVYVGTQIRF